MKFTEKQMQDLDNIMYLCSQSFDINIRIALAKSGIMMDNLLKDESAFVRRAIVDNGYKLESFLFDADPLVRVGVAKQGYGLEFLIHDQDIKVRLTAAKSDKLNREQINELVKDPCPEVRAEIAKKGEKLSKLWQDPSYLVRIEVAKHKYKLRELIKDENQLVRAEVASQGYNIKKLIDDESDIVRKAAYLYAMYNEDATSEWKLTSRGYVCGNCGFILERGKTATKRCPKCNFKLLNFYQIPTLKKRKSEG